MPDRNITFEIKEHLGTIAKYGTGWNKELNIISWNGGAPKFDIRDWDEHHVKLSRGVTLSSWEMRKMVDLYIARNNDLAVERGKSIEAERNARKEAAYQRQGESLPTEMPVEVETEMPAEVQNEIPKEVQTQLPVEPAAAETPFESEEAKTSDVSATEEPF